MTSETLELGRFTLGQLIAIAAFVWTFFAAIPGGHAFGHKRVAWVVAIVVLFPFAGLAYYLGGIANRLGGNSAPAVTGEG